MKHRILVAPLDWGLGHATRCIPILRELLAQGSEPWIATSGIQKELLQKDFSFLPFLDLEGYGVNYGAQSWNLPWKVMVQAPSVWREIRKEHHWLHRVHKIHRFHGIISDNRFGLHHPEIKSVFLTHQLAIKTGLGSWANNWVNRQNRRFIAKFDECWVPDWPGEENLAGDLSHPEKVPDHIKYIGPLSRFEPVEPSEKSGLLIILSGPEPQRTIFENKILAQLSQSDEKFMLVRGLSGEENPIHHPKGTIVNNLGSQELAQKIASAEFVVCRSGYSSIMDLVKLGKPMILVPTPGQPEQEYLFDQMLTKGMALGATQDTFNIIDLLHTARGFSFKKRPFRNEIFRDVIREWLTS